MSDETSREARESYEAGDYRRSRQASLTGLEINADDLELLRLGGKAGVELASEDAVTMLQKAVALDPDSAQSWHDLGEALAAEGRIKEAVEAFQKAAQLQPDDAAAQADYGHTAYAAGLVAEALEALQRAVELRPNDLATLHSLMEINRTAGRLDEALAAATRLADAEPDDAGPLLDLADLELALERFDDASAAFERVRQLDDDPEHDIYALHGMLLVELRRQDWQRAHELAEEALRTDPSRRTESIFGFFAAQSAAPRPDHPGQAEVDQVLAASHAEHRRLHSEEFAVL